MTVLLTNSEKKASEAINLQAFNQVALPGIKERVNSMLSLIGNSNEIFSTYTLHDESHVDAMLRHLDWVIPIETQKVMTPADWLLITMSIYFHDLGMIVTHEEFNSRTSNIPYNRFLEETRNNRLYADYIHRSKRMSSDEQEKFFFQEFIRESHAARIKEWITGRHTYGWGLKTGIIAKEMTDLLNPFPTRFREDLAVVCESHHRDNLNQLDKYPLFQRYGGGEGEAANVQYAALILRTVDLIHVTKDRTPSVIYRTIDFSDPKGVDEWKKQQGTFSVKHEGRNFDMNDENTHSIVLHADFTEERPFFALTEYIAWADREIKKSKKWNDQSRESRDGKDFIFPWKGIHGNIRVEGHEPQQMRFEFDRGRLLNLLVGHAIYNDATVAVRELLQNAIDAVRFRYCLDKVELQSINSGLPRMGSVLVSWNSDTRTLAIRDDGTGMDLDIIRDNLMCVGCSYYNTPQFSEHYSTFTPISRFGIGILTCFMISDDIEIVTVKGSQGHRIRMTSVQADYLLRELPLGDPKLSGIEPHGTIVTLTVREGVDLTDRTIEQILRHWIILPECTVEYSDTGAPPIRIGFSSPEDAVRSFCNGLMSESESERESTEVLTKKQVMNEGQCEMSFAVKSGWYPEREFISLRRKSFPAVCIEGIRVSDRLPGSKTDDDIVALVSVRGVKQLRTTVSRSGLEQDETYTQLGCVCADMLHKHIVDEVERIGTSGAGSLSRASSAGKFMSRMLSTYLGAHDVSEHLLQLRNNLSFIVLERTNENSRSLVSPIALQQEEFFWTIESRLVDSLGLLSRDMGRELTLDMFLNAFAPEMVDKTRSPILPDALLFRDDIMASYVPEKVQFSSHFQQTAIQWKYSSSGIGAVIRNKTNEWFRSRDIRRLIYDGMSQRDVDYSFMSRRCYVAELSGDMKNIVVVNSRLGLIVDSTSRYGKACDVMEKLCFHAVQGDSYTEYIRCIKVMSLLFQMLHGYDILRSANPYGVNGYLGKNEWIEAVDSIRDLFEKYKLLPDSVDNVSIVDRSSIFDASDYWRDWHRSKVDDSSGFSA